MALSLRKDPAEQVSFLAGRIFRPSARTFCQSNDARTDIRCIRIVTLGSTLDTRPASFRSFVAIESPVLSEKALHRAANHAGTLHRRVVDSDIRQTCPPPKLEITHPTVAGI